MMHPASGGLARILNTKHMKKYSILAIAWVILTLAAFGNGLDWKVIQIDGLPLYLTETRAIDSKDLASGKGPIDLSSTFRQMGVNIPEGGFILYSGNSLICNLDQQNHGLVDTLIQAIYRTDNLIATWRAYYKLLEPMSAEDRLSTVERIGFLPDPLVASILCKIRLIRSLPEPQPKDPFAEQDPPPAKPLSTEEIARLKHLEKTATDLLEISLRRLKEQLATIDAGKAEQKAEDKPPKDSQPSH